MRRLYCMFLLFAVAALPSSAPAREGAAPIEAAAKCNVLKPDQCPALKQLLDGGPKSFATVLAGLRAADQLTRYTASKIAGNDVLGPAAVRTAKLLAALPDTPGPIRGETLQALGRIGHADAAATLRKVVADAADDPRNRIYAANALGGYKTPATVQALIATLLDKVPRVQLAAAANLGRLDDKSAVPALINRAQSELTAGFVREACAVSLGRLKDPRALASLVVLMANEHATVRSAAIRALAALRDKTTVPMLLGAMGDRDAEAAIVDALGAIGDTRGIDGLIAVAGRKDAPKELRKRALWGLGSLAQKEGVAGVAALMTGDNNEIAAAAAETLGRIGHSTATAPLMAAIDTKDEQLLKSITWALQKITGKAHTTPADWKAWHATRSSAP